MDSDHLNHYNFENGKIGTAIILNHSFFDENGPKQRFGTEVDRDRICDVLVKYGFDIRCYNDKKIDEIIEILDKASEEDHNCLIIVVMTHGGPNRLWAKNGIYFIDLLFQPFIGHRTKLVGKPKLFFIQACRGENRDLGVPVTASFDYSFNELPHTIPTTADFFVMYATFEDHVSVRNPSNGTWFIQTLCSELEKVKDSVELTSLTTAVSHRIAHECWSQNQRTKQMPVTCSSLTKLVYLKPKCNRNDK